jgi:hypothetical protein
MFLRTREIATSASCARTYSTAVTTVRRQTCQFLFDIHAENEPLITSTACRTETVANGKRGFWPCKSNALFASNASKTVRRAAPTVAV